MMTPLENTKRADTSPRERGNPDLGMTSVGPAVPADLSDDCKDGVSGELT
jgi:hypothetical protein